MAAAFTAEDMKGKPEEVAPVQDESADEAAEVEEAEPEDESMDELEWEDLVGAEQKEEAQELSKDVAVAAEAEV